VPTPCVITGNLATLLGGNSAFGSVDFVLGNLGVGTVPRVLGTGIFPALKQTVQTDENGNLSAEIWGNDQIDPANTIYFVTFRDSNRNEVGQVQFYINGSTFNLNTAVAASTVFPPVLVQSGNINRLLTTLGTPLSSSDFILSGWGAGATISLITGTDTAVRFVVTAGSAPSVQPTVTLTYHDGSWLLPPMVISQMSGGTGAVSDITSSASPTGVTVTYQGLPLNGQNYIIDILTIGTVPNSVASNPTLFSQAVVATVNLTGLSANISATSLYVTTFSGLYRVSVYMVTTTTATTSTMPSSTVVWDDADNGVSQNIQMTPTNSSNTNTNAQQASAVMSVRAGIQISYSTAGYASSGPTMKYSLHIVLEAI
jgi:hypothetical protein